MSGAILTTGKTDYLTPKWFIEDFVRPMFHGTILRDPCANVHSHVGALDNYYPPYNDGLTDPWDYSNFVNPPYGKKKGEKGIGDWIEKAYMEEKIKHESILLIPAAIGTEAWKKFVFPCADGIAWVGCMAFEPKKAVIPRDLAAVYFGSEPLRFQRVFGKKWLTYNPSRIHGVYRGQEGLGTVEECA